MKNILYLILALLATSQILYAQNDGPANSGLSFLKLGIGARSIAMGEAYSSISDDATAFIYNPAALNFGPDRNVTISYNAAMVDLHNSFIGTKFKIGKIGLGIGLLKSGVDDIEIRTAPGAPIDKFNSSNFVGGISVSYPVLKELSLGITAKFIYEKIFINETSGFGIDLGTFYKKDNLSLAFMVGNIGSMGELKTESTKLPSLVRFGGSYSYPVKDFNFIFAIETFKVLDGGQLHITSGFEIGYKDMIFARGGYQTKYENKSLSAGVGFKYNQFTIDYAFIPYSDSFGTGNTFSIGFNF